MNALATRPQQYSLAPTNFDEAMRFAEIVAKSNFAPKGYAGKPGDVLVAVQMGAELGLAPMQALQSIAVINGRPSIWGDAMVAVCMAHPAFGGMHEQVDGDVATCTVIRKGMDPVIRTFSMADAKQAQLLGKQGPWTQYPKRMLQMRARGFALRDAFPDAMRGLVSQDEAQDYEPIKATVVQSRPVKQEPAPEPAKQAQLSPEAAALQAELDKPRDERHAAQIDPELDPEDYTIQANGKNKGKMLRELGIPQLEWYAENSRDWQLKAYANAAIMQRQAATIQAEPMQSAQGSWLDGEQAEVSP